MADKEPRRRKKRRESQKKDDVRSEDHTFFSSPKPESRDSDQEIEEEIVSHSHHGGPASNVAKCLFVILFSGLVVSFSFIFISLRGVDKSSVDMFDVGHDDHHAEVLHDEHMEEALHDEHDHHEEPEVTLDDFLPGLSSIFSLNNEQVKEVETPDIPSQDEDDNDDLKTESVETSTDQGILEEYIADTSSDIIEEPLSTVSYSDEQTSYSTYDYSEPEDFITPSMAQDKYESTPDPFSYDEAEDIPTTFSPNTYDDDEQNSFSIYERADITNEADKEIRRQLDEMEGDIKKDSNDDDDEDDDDDDDDDDDEDDEGVEEEFDFWQF